MQREAARLSPDEFARQVLWLMTLVRSEAPGLLVEQGARDRLRVVLGTADQASHFHRALLAENVDAGLSGRAVELRVAPWYSPEDVESLALAVAKVAHYLGL